MHRPGYVEECYFDYSFGAIRGESGQVAGVFNAVIETTYRVINERRTAFLRDLAERANVSHEFRTPLTLMLGPIDDGLLDRAEPLPPRQRERQELIQRNGARLLRLVNTLLDSAGPAVREASEDPAASLAVPSAASRNPTVRSDP